MLLEEGDEGQEVVSVQSSLVQQFWRLVGGADDHGAALEEGLEDMAQDQGISDVRDLGVHSRGECIRGTHQSKSGCTSEQFPWRPG